MMVLHLLINTHLGLIKQASHVQENKTTNDDDILLDYINQFLDKEKTHR